jgi:uncharacterized membrane protein
VPQDPGGAGLPALLPILLSYVLSYVTVAIYWINHHHLIHLVRRVTTRLLWANVHFLFWLSLLPFVTGYLGTHADLPVAAALYGTVATGCSLTFLWMRRGIATHLATEATLPTRREPLRLRSRNVLSAALLLASIPLAFVSPWLSIALFCLPPLMYFMPDDERVAAMTASHGPPSGGS